jgi:hypothetical protein
MEEKVSSQAPPSGGCVLCSFVFPMMGRMWSEASGDHFRNARVEFLKGVRSLIDYQIEQLSKHGEAKGTRVVVE